MPTLLNRWNLRPTWRATLWTLLGLGWLKLAILAVTDWVGDVIAPSDVFPLVVFGLALGVATVLCAGYALAERLMERIVERKLARQSEDQRDLVQQTALWTTYHLREQQGNGDSVIYLPSPSARGSGSSRLA